MEFTGSKKHKKFKLQKVKCCGSCKNWASGGQGMRDDIGSCMLTMQDTAQYQVCIEEKYLEP